MRQSFVHVYEYPTPYEGETVLDWVDRLHSQNISVNRIEILEWFWPNVAINLSYEAKEELLARHPDIRALSWAGRLYLSSTEEMMFLKLSAGSEVVHTPREAARLKEPK